MSLTVSSDPGSGARAATAATRSHDHIIGLGLRERDNFRTLHAASEKPEQRTVAIILEGDTGVAGVAEKAKTVGNGNTSSCRLQEGSHMHKLNVRERRFVDAYLGSCNGNGTAAALESGYTRSKNRRSAAVLATRLLRNVNVIAEIDARLTSQSAKAILSADERDEVLSEIARMPNADVRDRIRAISEMNKCGGRHVVRYNQGRHSHSGGLTLEQVLGESRDYGSTDS